MGIFWLCVSLMMEFGSVTAGKRDVPKIRESKEDSAGVEDIC